MQSQLKHWSWYIKICAAKIMCHGVSLFISLPHIQSFSTLQLQKSVKFANFELTYEIISFKDTQTCKILE